MTEQNLDNRAINTIRFLSVDAVQKANSGHPGLPMGAAAMAYVLWTRFLKHDPTDPQWPDRDRFVLSAGHGSMLLYSLRHLPGSDLSLADIQLFRAYGWHVERVEDGNDLGEVERALGAARQAADRPSLLAVRTVIGYGAPHKAGTFEAHGSPLGPEEVKAAKQNLGWPTEPPF